MPPCPPDKLAHYTCRRVGTPLVIDGRLDERAWEAVERSPRFVDMVDGTPGFFDTRAAALWDDQYFYVGYWIEEPFVRGVFTERDSLIFRENDVELFIDGGDCYYEFEINALGTIYEVFFVWQDAYSRGSRFDNPEFDLLSRRAVSYAGDYDRRPETFWRGTHPRRNRWAFLDWDFPGLRSAVHIDGTLNDDSDIDHGWTVELAFPWSGMTTLAGGRALPPRDGDTWRMFFGRFEALRVCGQEVTPHPGWSWSPHGAYDSHIPECFMYVHFSDELVHG
jgi:hypothetical protein